jgi:hypothetical protein
MDEDEKQSLCSPVAICSIYHVSAVPASKKISSGMVVQEAISILCPLAHISRDCR